MSNQIINVGDAGEQRMVDLAEYARLVGADIKRGLRDVGASDAASRVQAASRLALALAARQKQAEQAAAAMANRPQAAAVLSAVSQIVGSGAELTRKMAQMRIAQKRVDARVSWMRRPTRVLPISMSVGAGASKTVTIAAPDQENYRLLGFYSMTDSDTVVITSVKLGGNEQLKHDTVTESGSAIANNGIAVGFFYMGHPGITLDELRWRFWALKREGLIGATTEIQITFYNRGGASADLAFALPVQSSPCKVAEPDPEDRKLLVTSGKAYAAFARRLRAGLAGPLGGFFVTPRPSGGRSA